MPIASLLALLEAVNVAASIREALADLALDLIALGRRDQAAAEDLVRLCRTRADRLEATDPVQARPWRETADLLEARPAATRALLEAATSRSPAWRG